VTELIQEANRRVYERAHSDPATSGMGTNMTVALVDGDKVTIGHVGDSRAYVVRGGELEQLTEDHSLVNELLKSGKLSREEAETHPQRSVITRAVGTDPDVDVDAFTVEAGEGDVFLLCSDGLTDMVADSDILDVVEKNRDDLDRATKALVSAANRGGGEDNITVIAFSIAADGDDTVRMESPVDEDTLERIPLPTVDTMVVPPEEVEEVFVEPGSAAEAAVVQSQPITPAARIRLVLTMLALLGVAAVLLVWGLMR
jgi:protein phosphatase